MNFFRKIPLGFAIKSILFITTAVLLFHLLVVVEVIPYKHVWGGRLKSVEQMYILEAISMFMNFLILIVVLIRGEYIQPHMPISTTVAFSWIFFVLFTLNTLGNITSMDSLEAKIFTPITFILAILFLRLAIKEKT